MNDGSDRSSYRLFELRALDTQGLILRYYIVAEKCPRTRYETVTEKEGLEGSKYNLT